MNKVRATLAAGAVALGVLALPVAAGAQEIVPDDVLLHWRSYGAFAETAQEDVMRQVFGPAAGTDTGADATAGTEGTTATSSGIDVKITKANPIKVEKEIELKDSQSPVGVVIAAVQEAIGI